ncbi:MAG TPA: hypothetical protein VN870_09235 [Streptosporangiaceae bacterium]|nr:hypothetical protein [Streptosporangiaceae bacterium]
MTTTPPVTSPFHFGDPLFDAGFVEGARLALRDRNRTTWRHQIIRAARSFPRRGHPYADEIHPVARLAAVASRRRYAVGDRAPCCHFERLMTGLTWWREGIVWCSECGTIYRRRY